jgi:hypothetical protein
LNRPHAAIGEDLKSFGLFKMKTLSTSDDLRAVAFHEAGHTIAAIMTGSRIKSVEIGANPHLHCLHWDKASKAITALAGGLAEMRVNPAGAPWGTEVDLRCAHDVADRLAPGAQLEALEALFSKTQALLNRHWHAVELIADALLSRGKLSGAEINALVAIERRSMSLLGA